LVPIEIYVKNVIPDENPAFSFKIDGFWKNDLSKLSCRLASSLITWGQAGPRPGIQKNYGFRIPA